MSSKAIHITDYRKQVPGDLNMDRSVWEFPPVDTQNAHGKQQRWQIFVRVFTGSPSVPVSESAFITIADSFFRGRLPQATYGYIYVQSGLIGGKIREIVPTVVTTGKNIGKANETNPFTQALRDALGIYNKQTKKATGSGAATADMREMYPPMLALVLKDQKKPPIITPKTPVYVQRKYNGVRAVTMMNNGDAVMYSRRKKLYLGLNAIKADCATILAQNPDVYLDGEVYAHGVALQDISGYVRREESADDARFNYYVYDCFMPSKPDMIYSARRQMLEELIAATSVTRVKLVETFTATSAEECDKLYKQFVAEGYEGAMVRVDAPYEYSNNERHSKQLLKMKPTYDAEYQIVDWETGEKGKAAAALMIICTANGKEFPVTPTGELEVRNNLAKKFAEVEANGLTHFENQYKYRPLIVYYDELSKDGLPQRARTNMEIRKHD